MPTGLRRLDAVTVFVRIMAVLGVAYLVTVAALYGVLAERQRHFQANGPTVQGAVVALVRAQDLDSLRGSFYPADALFPVIEYTLDGQTRTFTASVTNAGQRLQIGQQVTLVYDLGDPTNPNDDLIAIKGEQMHVLESLPIAFVAAAGVSLWVLLTLTGVQMRRRFRARRDGRSTRSDPVAVG